MNQENFNHPFIVNLDEIQNLLGDLTEFDDWMFDYLLELNCPKKSDIEE